MKKIADAADPLYKTLDDGQKRRLAILTHMEGRFGGGWRHRGFEHGMMGGDRDRDGGRDHMEHMDHGDRDPSGSSRAARQFPELSRKSRRIPAAFSRFAPAVRAGKTSPVCWTSGNRFAKRRPLAKAFRGQVPGA